MLISAVGIHAHADAIGVYIPQSVVLDNWRAILPELTLLAKQTAMMVGLSLRSNTALSTPLRSKGTLRSISFENLNHAAEPNRTTSL